MDPDRFDALSRFLGRAASRQRVVRFLAGIGAAGITALIGADESLAARGRRKGKPGRRKFCDPDSKKKVAMCHCPPGNPANAHVICIADSGCGGHGNDLPCDCVCGKVPNGCVDHEGNPFPRCPVGRCKRDGSCGPSSTCSGLCNAGNFPCATTDLPNCRCLLGPGGNVGVCTDCPAERICGLACCPEGQICCNGSCVDPGNLCGGICGNVCAEGETCCDGSCVTSSTLCGGVCGNVCAAEETCCGSQCVPTADLCPDCNTICSGAAVCCDGGCSTSVECCLDAQCLQVCQTGECVSGTCEFTPVSPNDPGPFCNRSGDVCCEENGQPVCCRNGEVCLDTGCCTPLTCAAFPGQCGPQDDGCGGQTIDCPCPSGQVCGANGTCFTPECAPDSFEVACAGLQCGPASNGCGVDYDCGGCGSGEQCVTGACKAVAGAGAKARKQKRCARKGLAGQPCGGKKCKCKGGRRCHNGKCCEPVGDGSKHCSANSDCCPGLMCARNRPGQHKVCMRRNAKTPEETTSGTPELAGNGQQE